MLCTREHQSARIYISELHLPPSLQTAHIESSPSLRHVCQRAKQVSQNVNCVYSFIPAPFLLALFSLQFFYNNWRCEETAGRGLPLENFGVKTEELEQVCVFSFICCFLAYFSFGKIFNCAISLHLSHSFYPFLLVPSEAR